MTARCCRLPAIVGLHIFTAYVQVYIRISATANLTTPLQHYTRAWLPPYTSTIHPSASHYLTTMCRLLYRTYFCETEEAGELAHDHDAIFPEEQCRDALPEGLEYCDNLKRRISDNRYYCYALSCCFSRIREALYNWGVARMEAGDGYDDDTEELGQHGLKLAFEHRTRCGFRLDDFAKLRKEILNEFQLSDDRLSRRRVPEGYPRYKS